jgi:hypothetical protein
MDLTPLLCIIRSTNRPLLLLIQRLLLAVSVVSAILAISMVSRVDVPIVLLLHHVPLATRLNKLSSCFRNLNACVNDCEQIDKCLELLHGDLLHSLDVADSITEGVDDLDVLDIRDSIPGIAKMFHVVLEALIMLLLDGRVLVVDGHSYVP